MSREKLREAIGDWSQYADEAFRGNEGLKVLVAAARAYACERCEDGFVLKDESELEVGFTTCWKPCPDCADYRKIADGGEA